MFRAAREDSRRHARGFELRQVAAADDGERMRLPLLHSDQNLSRVQKRASRTSGRLLELGLELADVVGDEGRGTSSAQGRPWR